MIAAAPADDRARCLASLEAALAGGPALDLRAVGPSTLDAALRELVERSGAAAMPLVQQIAEEAPDKDLRKVARRTLYRLAQAGVPLPPRPPRPVVRRQTERAIRAWMSGIDGSGSRAAWIVFEGGVGGGLQLCSLILNDQAGILEVAGGAITRKRLEGELAKLRAEQKLPWVEAAPERAVLAVTEALALHERLGSAPPADFSRWRPLFPGRAGAEAAGAAEPSPPEPDPSLLERSAELLELPELGGWFLDPGALAEDGLALLQARESRLVVSAEVKKEREAAIVDGVIDRTFTPEAQARWARRFAEAAWILDATGQAERARIAEAVALALGTGTRPARALPVLRGMALRGLELAGDVALGRAKLSEVSRAPARPVRG